MENEPFNKLTDAEAERLAMLAEECAEVIQVVGKILRHGYDSYHPDDSSKTSNRQLLQKELDDVASIHRQLADDGIDMGTQVRMKRIWDRKLRYTHHQAARSGERK